MKQLNTLEDRVAKGSDKLVLLINNAITYRNTLPKPPPINTKM